MVDYEKYTDKSFVVRGRLMDDVDKRKELSKQFQGNCIWNTKLKGGSGLLVPVTDQNLSILNKYKNDNENILKNDDETNEKSEKNENTDDKNNVPVVRDSRDSKNLK